MNDTNAIALYREVGNLHRDLAKIADILERAKCSYDEAFVVLDPRHCVLDPVYYDSKESALQVLSYLGYTLLNKDTGVFINEDGQEAIIMRLRKA